MTRRLLPTGLFVTVGLLGIAAGIVQMRRWAGPSMDELVSVTPTSSGHLVLGNGRAEFTLTRHGNVRVRYLSRQRWISLQLPYDPPGRIAWDGETMVDAPLTAVDAAARVAGPGWPGRSVRLRGSGEGHGHRWARWVDVHLGVEPAGLLAVRLGYRNDGPRPMRLDRVTTLQTALTTRDAGGSSGHRPPLWSFHGVSERNGQPAIVPLAPGVDRPNVMGVMDRKGRGGGIPLVAAWSRDMGLAWGHLEWRGAPISLPVRYVSPMESRVAVEIPGKVLAPGESFETPWLFVEAYAGDFYAALREYAQTLRVRGWRPVAPSPAAYEPTWCGWGFGRGATPAEMIGALPALERLDLGWATVDEGWFEAIGDWTPRHRTYGEQGMRRVVDAYTAAGVRAQLWWLPIGAEAGTLVPALPHDVAQVVREHPDWLVRGADGRPIPMVHGLGALCPALPEVRAYHRSLVRRFLGEWGFDGLKLDYMFTVPECHDPRHGHASPRDSVNAMADLLGEIVAEAKRLKPDSVTQICSCGALPNVAWLGYEDQPVTADPADAGQVRRRIKIYKALLGDRTPVYGDHVELTDTTYDSGRLVAAGSDFASTVGPGGVPGTRFVWPGAHPRNPELVLTPERERHWRRWLDLYRAERLAEGQFRSLYTYGFDWPEAYVVARGKRMYYAFFAAAPTAGWEGTLELRGLSPGRYRLRDYEHERDLGIVKGPVGELKARFEQHLLVEATPVQAGTEE